MVIRAQDSRHDRIQKIVLRLREARTQPEVRLSFKDGREVEGAITFVERLGTGRLINVDNEFSLEFSIHDIDRVQY
ncbi:MAG TPA: hypothetical protein VGC54_06980 [Planctomycetota bacterium]